MKTLVAYASKRGSTAEIAEAVAKALREADFEVDCRKRGDARHFLRKHPKQLAEQPLWAVSLEGLSISRRVSGEPGVSSR